MIPRQLFVTLSIRCHLAPRNIYAPRWLPSRAWSAAIKETWLTGPRQTSTCTFPTFLKIESTISLMYQSQRASNRGAWHTTRRREAWSSSSHYALTKGHPVGLRKWSSAHLPHIHGCPLSNPTPTLRLRQEATVTAYVVLNCCMSPSRAADLIWLYSFQSSIF